MNMGGMRENASVWFHLFAKHGSIKYFIKRKVWKSEYFWHDSFWRYLWFVVCLITGHRFQRWIDDGNGFEKLHCFNCERDLDWRADRGD